LIYQRAFEFARAMLSEERFEHSLSTAKYGYRLGKQYGVDPERVYLTGLLHDVARELPASSLLLHARKQGIILRKEEKTCPFLLHGKVAAFIVRKELGIKDKGVLDGIASHIVGRRHWTKLEQIVYLADKVEPTRVYPSAGIVRKLLEEGEFERALLEGLRNAIVYAAQTRGWIVDTETVVVFNEITKTQA
jgi:predicted HD superfamily hydrolase involved in NAD metabolism